MANEASTTEMTLGELIRRKRRDLRWNQTEAGEHFHVNQSTVARWERGEPPGPDHLEPVADWVGVTLEDAFRRCRKKPLPAGGDLHQQVAEMRAELDVVRGEMDAMREEFSEVSALVRQALGGPAPKKASAKKKAPGKAAAGKAAAEPAAAGRAARRAPIAAQRSRSSSR